MEAAFDAGAISASYIVLRLPWEVNPLFKEWLQAHFPDRAQRVMNRVREMRNGKDYDAAFGTRMHGEGVWADLIRQRFEKTAARLGMGMHGRSFRLDTAHFRPPAPPVTESKPASTPQMDLF
jgi:DNA repair photolyase